MTDELKHPTQNVGHPLHEKLVWPLRLTDVTVLVEGIDPTDGKIYRLRSAGTVDFVKPEDLSLVEVTPVPESGIRALTNAIPPRSRHYLVLAGELLPASLDGDLYVVEILKEREL